MQKLAATSKINHIDTKTVLSHTCLTNFEKDYDKIKHVSYNLL